MTDRTIDTAVTFSAISPYLYYPDGDAATAWLTRVFGFGPTQKLASPDGTFTEGEIAAGSVVIQICGKHEPTGDTGRGMLLILTVDDVDALHARIVDAGVTVDPPKDENYGPRSLHVVDPWGYRWYFWQGAARYS